MGDNPRSPSMSSALSSLCSFTTAQQPNSPSAQSVPSSGATPRDEDAPANAPMKAVPTEISTHLRIYLEDGLHSMALNLANSLLTAGLSRPDGQKEPCQVPPPVQLAFIINLTVHPKHTSRADPADRAEVALLSSNYLNDVLRAVGPVNARFNEAFQFNPNYQPSRTGVASAANGRRSSLGGGDGDDEADAELDVANDDTPVGGKMGGEQLLWNCGADFWSVVGWAFNCAVVHPARWRWWRPWLDFMLNALWEDWQLRLEMDYVANRDRAERGEEPVETRDEMIGGSLLASYVSQRRGGGGGGGIRRDHHGLKYIVKALFADGRPNSLSLFPEVFPRETKGLPRGQNGKRKRGAARLDLDNMQYGDYVDSDDDLDIEDDGLDDDSLSSNASSPMKPGVGIGRHHQYEMTAFEHYSQHAEVLQELVPFRLRIMELLAQAANYLPSLFVQHGTLYQDLAEAMRHQPLPVFEALLRPDGSGLHGTLRKVGVPGGDLAALLRELLHRWYLPPKHFRDPAKVDPVPDSVDLVSWPMLELCYLPHAASSAAVDDNARLSVLLDKCVRMLIFEASYYYHPPAGGLDESSAADRLLAGPLPVGNAGLGEALRKGIEARDAKAKVRKGRNNGKVSDQERVAKEMLDASAKSLGLVLAHMEKVAAEKGA